MASTLQLIYNVEDPLQQGLLDTFLGTVQAVTPEFVRGDRTLAVTIRPVVPSLTPRPWDDDFATGDTFRFAIGNADQPPTGGTFSLNVNGTTTGLTALAYNISAATLQTALSAASVTAGFGTLTVENPATGVYVSTWTTPNTPVPAIVASSINLTPYSEIVVSVIKDGDETPQTYAQQVISLRQQNVVFSEPATLLPAAGVTRTYDQTATSVNNSIVRISFDAPGTYAGLYTINAIAGGYNASCGQAGPLMTVDQLGLVLANHPAIFYQDDTNANNVAVTKDGEDFIVEFIGDLAGSALVKTINDATVANPTELTTSENHAYRTGDSITITGSTGITPSINGTHTITVTAANKFTIPVNVTVASGESATTFNNTESTLTVSDVSLLSPKGVTGVIDLNTYNLATAFWATTQDELTFTMSIERQRASGEIRTGLLIPVTIKRDIIDVTSLVPVTFPGTITAQDLRQDNTLFVDLVYGNNTTAEREYLSLPYAGLLTASAAASSGDLIVLRPASYTVSENMGADGVNWYLPAGTTVSASGDLESGIFDDSANGLNAPFSFTVDGAAVISYESTGETTPFVHAINITNASSEVVIRCKKVIGDTNDDGSDSSGAVAVLDGSLELTCEEVVSTGKGYCVYWENGDMSVKAHKIIGAQNGAVSSVTNATPTGKFWVEALEITSSASSVINTAGNQTAARVWVNAQEVSAASGFHALDIIGSEKIYVTAQKISNTGAESAVLVASGEAWLKVDKITADDTMLELTGGTSWIDLQELEVGSATAAYCIICSGGTHVIKGARFTGGASSLGINVTGGTLTLIDCYINTAANASARPITKSGGTLILQNCTLVAEATQDSIEASTAQNVKVYGTSVANKAKDANVTIQVGTLTVSTDVF